MVHSDILYCFLNVKKSPRFSELKINVLSMNRFEKKKWQIKCDWFKFKHAIFPSLFHNLMTLIQFIDTQHNLSLPALTEYWLFFDMKKKKK